MASDGGFSLDMDEEMVIPFLLLGLDDGGGTPSACIYSPLL
jgi:hypothetical protein